MTSISLFLRGYRMALRDVQCTTERFTKVLTRGEAPILALFMVADRIATEIWELRSAGGDALRILRDSEGRFRGHVPDTKDTLLWLPRVIFGRGYRAVFDRARQLMTGQAWEVNDPVARMGIREMVLRFERIRFEIASNEDGTVRTLRARKFVV